MKKSRRLVAALAAAAAMPALFLAGSGVAGAQPTNPSPAPGLARAATPATADSLGYEIGPVINPDTQRTDANGVANVPANSKSKSGETDFKSNPKKTREQVQREAQAETKAREAHKAKLGSDHVDEKPTQVETRELLPSGHLKITVYEPAPGVSDEQLVANLKSEGKASAEIRDTATSPAAGGPVAMALPGGPDICSYGYATTMYCPSAYWTNNGYADPIVRFNDHAGANWKTDEAVYLWNTVPNIDLRYQWNSCPFMGGARCIDVWDGNYGNNGYIGRWEGYYQPAPNTRKFWEPTTAYPNAVYLNNWYNPAGVPGVYAAFNRDSVIDHEVGHVTGIGHNGWQWDVMYEDASLATNTGVTGGQNADLLANLYSVAR